MGMAGQGPLRPRQNHSPRSVLEKSDPYWREMMLAKNMMGHPQDHHHLEKTERGNKRAKMVSRASQREKDGNRRTVSKRGAL